MSTEPPTYADVLDGVMDVLSGASGLTVVEGMPYDLPLASPFAYVLYEGHSYEASGQVLRSLYRVLIRVLVPWQDQWQVSERALAALVDSVPRLFLTKDGLTLNNRVAGVQPNTIRVDAGESGDGFTTVRDTLSFRSFALRFTVKG